jgi:hypothetical protein
LRVSILNPRLFRFVLFMFYQCSDASASPN